MRRDGSSYIRYSAVITTKCTLAQKQKRLEGPSRKTHEEAFADLEKLHKTKTCGSLNAYTTNLDDYLDYWLSQVRPRETWAVSRKQLAPKTYQGYRGDVEHFIRPALGNLKLGRLEPIALQRWQDGLAREHGPFVAKNASATLSSAFVTNASGGVPTTGHLRREFYRLSEIAKVRRIKFHGLRHTAGSLWIEAGVSLLRASRWLGHSHMQTTEKIYIHLLREAFYGEGISLERMLNIGA